MTLFGEEPQDAKLDGATERSRFDVLAFAIRVRLEVAGLHVKESPLVPVPAVAGNVIVTGLTAQVAFGCEVVAKPTVAYAPTMIRLIESPTISVEIAKILKNRGVPESTIYYQLDRGLKAGGIKDLNDGHIGPPQREQVKGAVLKVMGRSSPAGFYFDSSSTPGYGLEMVAHEVGLPPLKVQSDFYSVMHELWGKYLELGSSKDRFFSLFGWKQVEPSPNASYAPGNRFSSIN